MTIKDTIYRGRVRTVEDAVHFWKVSHDDAMAVRDIEDIVAETIATLKMLMEWHKEGWSLLRSGKLKNVIEYGNSLLDAYTVARNLVRAVDECIALAEARGYTVDHVSQYRIQTSELERRRTEFVAKWPFPTPEELKVSEAGDYVDLGAWINDLQSAN